MVQLVIRVLDQDSNPISGVNIGLWLSSCVGATSIIAETNSLGKAIFDNPYINSTNAYVILISSGYILDNSCYTIYVDSSVSVVNAPDIILTQALSPSIDVFTCTPTIEQGGLLSNSWEVCKNDVPHITLTFKTGWERLSTGETGLLSTSTLNLDSANPCIESIEDFGIAVDSPVGNYKLHGVLYHDSGSGAGLVEIGRRTCDFKITEIIAPPPETIKLTIIAKHGTVNETGALVEVGKAGEVLKSCTTGNIPLVNYGECTVGLPPNTYIVRVTKEGFETYISDPFTLTTDRTLDAYLIKLPPETLNIQFIVKEGTHEQPGDNINGVRIVIKKDDILIYDETTGLDNKQTFTLEYGTSYDIFAEKDRYFTYRALNQTFTTEISKGIYMVKGTLDIPFIVKEGTHEQPGDNINGVRIVIKKDDILIYDETTGLDNKQTFTLEYGTSYDIFAEKDRYFTYRALNQTFTTEISKGIYMVKSDFEIIFKLYHVGVAGAAFPVSGAIVTVDDTLKCTTNVAGACALTLTKGVRNILVTHSDFEDLYGSMTVVEDRILTLEMTKTDDVSKTIKMIIHSNEPPYPEIITAETGQEVLVEIAGSPEGHPAFLNENLSWAPDKRHDFNIPSEGQSWKGVFKWYKPGTAELWACLDIPLGRDICTEHKFITITGEPKDCSTLDYLTGKCDIPTAVYIGGGLLVGLVAYSAIKSSPPIVIASALKDLKE